LRFLLLRHGAFVHHFLEDVACPFGVTHIHVGACQVQLRTHFTHRHRLEVRQREVIGSELLCRRERCVGDRRRSNIEVQASSVAAVRVMVMLVVDAIGVRFTNTIGINIAEIEVNFAI
jgi:hypothetical protein